MFCFRYPMKESRVVFSSAQSFCVCFFIIFFYQRLPTAKPNVCFAFYSLILLFESIYYYFMFISAFIQRVFFCAVCRSLNNSFTSIFRFAYIITEWLARLLWLLLFFSSFVVVVGQANMTIACKCRIVRHSPFESKYVEIVCVCV